MGKRSREWTAVGNSEAACGLLALFAAVAAAITARTQLNRYDEMAKSYAVACQELLLIATAGRKASTAMEALVSDGETAISREQKMPIAKRGEPLDLESIPVPARPGRAGR